MSQDKPAFISDVALLRHTLSTVVPVLHSISALGTKWAKAKAGPEAGPGGVKGLGTERPETGPREHSDAAQT